MDSSQNGDVLKNYENMFNAQVNYHPLGLYSNANQSTIENSNSHKTPNVKEVINNVTLQVKAFQSADCLKAEKKSSFSSNEYKKSSFIPVNMFALYEKKREENINGNSNKFETQCVSDTQLIDLVENAEALIDTNKEISHEFDTTFNLRTDQINDDEDIDVFKELDDDEVIDVFKELDDDEVTNKSRSPEILTIRNISLSELTGSSQFSQNKSINDNCTQLLNETIKIEPNRPVEIKHNNGLEITSLNTKRDSPSSPMFNVNDDDELPSSYVFNNVRSPKSSTLSPLVFNLETFESFENKAALLINNMDVTERSQETNEKQNNDSLERGSISPVLKLSSKCKAIKKRKDKTSIDISNIAKEITVPTINNKNAKQDESKIVSTIYEDEILFSSDEEEDYVCKETEDLPLTCALETSFYAQSGVLDKTMYVAFQTASCKSIQVSCESFERAKSVFDDLNANPKTFKDLVDICDSLTTLKDEETNIEKKGDVKSKSPFWIMESEFDFKDNMNSKATDFYKIKDEIKFVSQNVHESKPEFITATNKVMNLSEQSITRCRKVFQDINVAETYEKSDATDETENTGMISLHNKDPHYKTRDEDEDTKLDDEVLKEFENTNIPFSNNINFQSINKDEKFVGFKTTSDKNISISDKTLTKCQDIFQDIDISYDIKRNIESSNIENNSIYDSKLDSSNDFIKKITTAEFTGFKTASNKNIVISDKALERTTKVLGDIDKLSQSEIEYRKNNFAKEDYYPVHEKHKESIHIKNLNKDTVNYDSNDPFIDDSLKYCFDSEFVLHDDDALTINANQIEIKNADVATSSNKDEEDSTFKIPESIGFKTASNKKVIISAKALANSKKIFHSIEQIDIDNSTLNANDDTCVSFKMASNNKMKNANEALMKTKPFFQGIVEDNETGKITKEFLPSVIDNVATNIKERDIISFLGFQTASNKKILVSAEALAKSTQIFVDINNTDRNALNNVEDLGNAKISKDTSLTSNLKSESDEGPEKYHKKMSDVILCKNNPVQTACNKNNTVSLYESNKHFDTNEPTRNDVNLQNFEKDSKTKQSSKTVSEFVGFLTASNKEIKISNDALARSKKLFENIDETSTNSELASDKENTFQGIGPRNNEVNISVESLSNTQKHEGSEISIKSDAQTIKRSGFSGFQTASNKEVSVSETALIKSRKLFDNIDTNVYENSKQDNEGHVLPCERHVFIGFQTASKKQVNVSEEALIKSRKLFEDINEVTDNPDDSATKGNSFKGFHTARNRNVTISKNALAAAKTLFDGIDNEEIVNKPSGFQGFQTASNKQVTVSNDALAKSRKIFSEINYVNIDQKNITLSSSNREVKEEEKINDTDVDYLIKDLPDEEPIFRGFKTGNDSKVNISKDALEKSRKLLSDFNIDSEKPTDKINSPDAIEKTYINTTKDTTIHSHDRLKEAAIDNFENIIDTQVVNDFDETLNTEDFRKETPKVSKRSGSPILSCPKAKRRKIFSTPYNTTKRKYVKLLETNEKQNENVVVFDENYKKRKKHTYHDLPDNRNKCTDQSLQSVDFETILNFEFKGTRNEMNDKVWTMDNIKEAFLCSVNKKIIPEGWLVNHLKLILWKLISYEIRFRIHQVCTVKNVMEQLKYRYDRELYRVERPAIRKILERDETSTKTMVLCVVGIYSDGVKVSSVTNTKNIELLLTDGWYCVKATIDNMLSKLVYDGKIVVGCKIATHGAELMNCEQGMSPWENTSAVRLKLSGNSTRRAVWTARLGYHGNAAMLSRLSAVSVEGGRVSRLRASVARVYPTLYVERFDDQSTVTRSERLENLHQMKHETERQNLLEKLYEEVEKEIFDQESQDSEPSSSGKRRCLESGSQISKLMKKSGDPTEFMMRLTSSQTRLLDDHTAKEREKLLEKIQEKVQEKLKKNPLYATRNVVPLLKIRVAGVEERNGSVEVSKAMISIWKPNDAILEIIKEGAWIDVMNVIPTAIRNTEIQISAGRQSLFRKSNYKQSDKTKPFTQALKRICYNINELTKNCNFVTNYNEIDTVGLIFEIDPPMESFDQKNQPFQNIYIADEDKNIICINFWGGIKKFGYENILSIGEVVTCVNLQKRAGNTRKNIPQYRVTEFTYFTRTPKNIDARKIYDLILAKFVNIDKKKFCSDCVALKNNYFLKRQQEVSPYRLNQSDYNMSRNKIFLDSPLTVKKDEFNLSGLDFESSFQTELSPQALIRKNRVKDKIAKLKMYGEPPALSPICIKNISKNATSAYKSPLQSDSSNVASTKSANVPKSVEKSPVLLSRASRKLANPVKLNFSCQNDTIDHFAEEFEASPLS